MYWPSLPWRRINDFLLEAGSARSRDELNARVCDGMTRLIPHDIPVTCFVMDRDDLRVRGAVGSPVDRVGSSLFAVAGPQRIVSDYNDHFRFAMPLTYGYLKANAVIDYRAFEDTEFVADFVLPLRVRISLAGWFLRYTVLVSRSAGSCPFTDTEIAASKIVSRHLENLYVLQSRRENASPPSPYGIPSSLVARFGLTGREREIAQLLAERVSTAEISDRLFISRRTAEKHLEHIYAKLGARNRGEVRRLLQPNSALVE